LVPPEPTTVDVPPNPPTPVVVPPVVPVVVPPVVVPVVIVIPVVVLLPVVDEVPLWPLVPNVSKPSKSVLVRPPQAPAATKKTATQVEATERGLRKIMGTPGG
jgi:hypothetical protein